MSRSGSGKPYPVLEGVGLLFYAALSRILVKMWIGIEQVNENTDKQVTPGTNVIKPFFSVITNFRNKPECLSMASHSSLVYYLWARPGIYPIMKHLKGSSIG
jgi:hypothetical protein